MDRYLCLHGHFYQPPRENPWLEEIELQDSAYPYHDWNERITAQCYSPNAASRIFDSQGQIVQITNNYSKISFNFGPTLLSWLERHDPDTYHAILEADRLSADRFSGHGSALAQVYNHMIMPLAAKRDKVTQVSWGIQDFRQRFKRDPEGMWLAETAVDLETLEVLAEFGIRFTLLAPRQAARVREIGHGEGWEEVTGGRIDPSRAYRCFLPSGKSISYAVSSLFEDYSEETCIYCYHLQREIHRVHGSGKLRLAIGKTHLRSDLTWDTETLSYAVLHLGDHNLNGAVRNFQGDLAFSLMAREIEESFDRGDVLEVIRLMDRHFGVNNFSIWHLFKDEQRKVVNQILELTHSDIEVSYRRIYDHHFSIMNFLRDLDIPLSKPFEIAAEYIINVELRRLFGAEQIDLERLEMLISVANRWQLALEGELLGYTASPWVSDTLRRVRHSPVTEAVFRMRMVAGVLSLLATLPVELDLRKAQNAFFSLGRESYGPLREKAGAGDEEAGQWLAAFGDLAPRLNVSLP